jgi:hypothetical protein
MTKHGKRPETEGPEPDGPGWERQTFRFRLRISLERDIAIELDEDAQALGMSPAALVSMIVGDHFARRRRHR